MGRRWRPVSIVAAAMVVVGVAATYALTVNRSEDSGEVASTGAATTPAEISMVPPALPDGYSLSVAMDSVVKSDPIQRRVYARASDPTDASSWINVWFAVTSPEAGPLEVTCTDQTDNQPFTIGDLTAATCRLGGGPWRSAVWKIGDVVVDVTASSGVTREELVAFSQSLATESIEEPQVGLPTFNLVPAAPAVGGAGGERSDPRLDDSSDAVGSDQHRGARPRFGAGLGLERLARRGPIHHHGTPRR